MRARERGGVAVLVALALLVCMTVGALGASRDVLREWGIGGSGLLGAKAFLAADSGLEWGRAGAAGLEATLQTLRRLPSPGPVVQLPAEGELPLEEEGNAPVRNGFRVDLRYLGRLERPPPAGQALERQPPVGQALELPPPAEQAEDCIPGDDLWELTSHGTSRVGNPGSSQEVYQQTCQALLASAGSSQAQPCLPVRMLGWRLLR